MGELPLIFNYIVRGTILWKSFDLFKLHSENSLAENLNKLSSAGMQLPEKSN
jgi:hypothetical protein